MWGDDDGVMEALGALADLAVEADEQEQEERVAGKRARKHARGVVEPYLSSFPQWGALPSELRLRVTRLLDRRTLLAVGCVDRAHRDLILHEVHWEFEFPRARAQPSEDQLSRLGRVERRAVLRQVECAFELGRHLNLHELDMGFIKRHQRDKLWYPRLRHYVLRALYSRKLVDSAWRSNVAQVLDLVNPFRTADEAAQYLEALPSLDRGKRITSRVVAKVVEVYPKILKFPHVEGIVRTVWHDCSYATMPISVAKALADLGSPLCLRRCLGGGSELGREAQGVMSGLCDVIGVKGVALMLLQRKEREGDTEKSVLLELGSVGHAEYVKARSWAFLQECFALEELMARFHQVSWDDDDEQLRAIVRAVVVRVKQTKEAPNIRSLFQAHLECCDGEKKALLVHTLLHHEEIGCSEAERLAATVSSYPFALSIELGPLMREAILGHVPTNMTGTSPLWALEALIFERSDEYVGSREWAEKRLQECKFDDLVARMEGATKWKTAGGIYRQGWGDWNAILFEGGLRVDISAYGYARVLAEGAYMTYEDSTSPGLLKEMEALARSHGLNVLSREFLAFSVPEIKSRRFSQSKYRCLEEYLYYWED